MQDMEITPVGERTKLNRANNNSPSLRTTVPEGVVSDLKVEEGDSLEWERIVHDGKIVIRIKKAEK